MQFVILFLSGNGYYEENIVIIIRVFYFIPATSLWLQNVVFGTDSFEIDMYFSYFAKKRGFEEQLPKFWKNFMYFEEYYWDI